MLLDVNTRVVLIDDDTSYKVQTTMKNERNAALDEYDSDSVTSDDALCELLGIQSLNDVNTDHCCESEVGDEDENELNDVHQPKKCQSVDDLIRVSDEFIAKFIQKYDVIEEYQTSNVCLLPLELRIPSSIMRRLTDELVWGNDSEKNLLGIDRTFETTKFMKDGTTYERSTLTRLENLNGHSGWYDLCNNYIRRCVSSVCGEEMILYKTKLNLKPPGGSGFAPHVDTPSLIVPFGTSGPQTFVTVMIAIDDMTTKNGCLRVAKGSTETRCPIIPPERDGNPDSNGRAGAIPIEDANAMNFEDLCCTAGSICIFDGWVPHRSGTNQSNFARRAVFLTYNPASEGDYYDLYYQRMKQLRNDWKVSLSCASSGVTGQQDPEIQALSTIPRI
jgi:ectoine hydroxylase-related dioxygenase (phytanoyl-CoA dioxygenase family)